MGNKKAEKPVEAVEQLTNSLSIELNEGISQLKKHGIHVCVMPVEALKVLDVVDMKEHVVDMKEQIKLRESLLKTVKNFPDMIKEAAKEALLKTIKNFPDMIKEAAKEALDVTPRNEPLYTDEKNYKTALMAYRDSVSLINDTIDEFKKLFNVPFTETDFKAIISYNTDYFRNRYERLIEEDTQTFKFIALDQNIAVALKKVEPFISKLQMRLETNARFSSGISHHSFSKIRFESGAAVFNEKDEADLKRKFSIDLTRPDIVALLIQIESLKVEFDKLYSLLKTNESLGFNPERGELIGDYGLLFCNRYDGYRLTLNQGMLIKYF